jgi:hypothetical protein
MSLGEGITQLLHRIESLVGPLEPTGLQTPVASAAELCAPKIRATREMQGGGLSSDVRFKRLLRSTLFRVQRRRIHGAKGILNTYIAAC